MSYSRYTRAVAHLDAQLVPEEMRGDVDASMKAISLRSQRQKSRTVKTVVSVRAACGEQTVGSSGSELGHLEGTQGVRPSSRNPTQAQRQDISVAGQRAEGEGGGFPWSQGTNGHEADS